MDDTKKLIEKYKRELMELSGRTPKAARQNTVQEKRSPQIIGYADSDHEDIFKNIENNVGEFAETGEKNRVSADDESEKIIVKLNGSSSPEEGMDGFVNFDDLARTVNSNKEETDDLFERNDETFDNAAELFNSPQYNDIPSTREVQEEITAESDPANNDYIDPDDVSGVTDNSAATPRADLANVQSVTPEQAETLNDVPISGTDENETLTGRSFEDPAADNAQDLQPSETDDMRQGSGASIGDFPQSEYDNWEAFEAANSGRGTVEFRVYTAQQAVPIEGALCVITKTFNNGDVHRIDALITDRSGQTTVERLPAPSRELSQLVENHVQPFALYDAKVTKDGFAEVILKDIPVFDGIESIQRVMMIPD